jgi:hypothetical protein
LWFFNGSRFESVHLAGWRFGHLCGKFNIARDFNEPSEVRL